MSQTLSSPFDISTTEGAIRFGLYRCAELFFFSLNVYFVDAWLRALDHFEPCEIRQAFAETIDSFIPTAACPFPVPAHIVRIIHENRKCSN